MKRREMTGEMWAVMRREMRAEEKQEVELMQEQGREMELMRKWGRKRRGKRLLPFVLLGILSVFFCWFFVGRLGIFGSRVDWISQHSVIPDYFRQQFYDTGELFPDFAANIGGGQNIYNFSYYGLLSPVILVSYLLPFVKMGDYLMAAGIVGLAASVLLLYGWLLRRGFSEKISFVTALMYLLSGPMIFHSYCQIMFVNYMPFLCMAFIGVDRYFENGKKALYTFSVFLMIMTSFYFSIGGMLAIVLYGIHRYLEMKGHVRASDENVKAVGSLRDGKEENVYLGGNVTLLSFLWDGVRFCVPLLTAVLMSGILLIPTAAALTGREGAKGDGVSLASLFIPNMKVGRLLYTPYGIGLTTLAVTALITGLFYRELHDRVLAWGCMVILTIPFFCWAFNGGLYIREKALIPLLPLLCYLIACYLKKQEEMRISFVKSFLPFVLTVGILCWEQVGAEYEGYGGWILIDGVAMAVFFLLFRWRKQILYLMVPPVAFLILFGSGFHEQAGRIEDRAFYEKVTDPAVGQAIEEILNKETGFYRVEQVGSDEENAADLNRVWDVRQYISSLYSSSYNQDYQEFRKNVFHVEEPFRNVLMQSVSRNPVFLKLMGVRYLISSEEVPGYELVRTVGDIHIYENKETAPVAYVTDQVISEKAFEEMEFPYDQMALGCRAVVPGGDEEEGRDARLALEPVEFLLPESVQPEEVQLETVWSESVQPVEVQLETVWSENVQLESVRPGQMDESLRIEKKGNGYRIQAKKNTAVRIDISGSKGQQADRILFLQFQVKNNKPTRDVTVWLEGERNKLSAQDHTYYNENTVFSFGVPVEKGKESVELTFGKGDYEITEIRCFLGDWGEQDRQESGSLYQSVFRVDWERTGGNVIAGAVEVDKDGYFVTSIPYDTHFTVLLDGKEVGYEKVNMAFLGFPMEHGGHTVEIIYHAPGKKAGVMCSGLGVLLCCVLVFPGRRRRSRIEKACR